MTAIRWIPAGHAIQQIAKAVSHLSYTRTKSIIYDTALSRQQTVDYVQNVLGMELAAAIDADAASLCLEERLISGAELPDWFENGLWDKDVDRTARDLCISMGLSLPWLIAICGYAPLDIGTHAVDEYGNDVLVRLNFRRHTGATSRTAYDVEVKFNNRITYQNGLLTIDNMAIPETMVNALKGQTVDKVLGHPWEGWKKIRIKSVSQTGERVKVKIESGMTALVEEDF